MEAPDRPARDRLTLLRALAAEPSAYGFYHAARLIECTWPDLPRLGTSRRLREDPVRFGQDPSLSFALATLAALELGQGGSPPRLLVRFTGLIGPNGPLPLHLTEFARDRLRNHGDNTFIRFLDVFHHRVFTMFYRAWADAQPTVSLDRPGQDPFGDRLASLAGYGTKTLQGRDEVPEFSKRAHAGLLANSVRSAEGLARILSNFFRVPARVEQWQPHWMKLPTDSLTRIGLGQENARLGVTAVLGAKVWDCQSRFRVVIGPVDLAQYVRFLPGQPSLRRLRDWVRNYMGDELSCEMQLLLKRPQVPSVTLGKAGQLGWTSWLGKRPPATHPDAADELVLRVL
ncbi:MAG: type VI secretion system baseplate subunit TssG [Ideonella sp.]|nr:type VI secretion system baseplate subunit TssG [Ideonella sp.]